MPQGYDGSNAIGWAAHDYGCPYASGCSTGTPHNCTLYAAFRLMENGYGNPGWSDNADEWAIRASENGVPVNQTPDVGSIAEWNGGVGHVAYVESWEFLWDNGDHGRLLHVEPVAEWLYR